MKRTNASINKFSRLVNTDAKSGLFGLQLYSPDDFAPLCEKVVQNCKKYREQLADKSQPLSVHKRLFLMDSISNEVCSAVDPAELCRNVHENPDFTSAAEESFGTLSNFINVLNSDSTMYFQLKQIFSDSSIWETLSEEEKIFALDMMKEFEVNGIHLPTEKKYQLNSVLEKVVQFESTFMQNAGSNNELFAVGPLQKEHAQSLQNWLKQYVPQPSHLPSDHIQCTSNPRISMPLINALDDEANREQLFQRCLEAPIDNKRVLSELIWHRQHHSMELGYRSYAHSFLLNKAIKTPEAVFNMLGSLSDAVREKADRECVELLMLKKQLDNTATELKPWDVSYLKYVLQTSREHQQKASRGASGGKRSANHQDLSSFFPLSACLEGLVHLCEQLFGFHVLIEPIDPRSSEGWVSGGGNEGSAGLYKATIFSGNNLVGGEILGQVYLDLFSRPRKFGGSAHFTIQCGCKRRFDGDMQAMGQKSRNVDLDQIPNEFQVPIVALVLNLSAPSSAGSSSSKLKSWLGSFSSKNNNNNSNAFGSSDNPVRNSGVSLSSSDVAHSTLLSLQDVETLHHEWGHVLHSVLSRTTFQHLSGTRTSLDFAEVPSHLFEYFARTPSVVSSWARHYQTGERVSPDEIQERLETKQSFAAIELQHQILYSAADQYVFGAEMADFCSQLKQTDAHKGIYDKALDGITALQGKYTSLPLGYRYSSSCNNKDQNQNQRLAATSMSVLTHSHFVNYGAGYYSYLFARMHAAQIWSKRFAQNPLSRASGDLLWKHMLQYGAAKDPLHILSEMSGGEELNPSYFLQSI